MDEGTGADRVDLSELLEQFDGDRAVVCEIVEAYLLETRENLERLPERLARGDAREVRRQAHTLGGTMRLFGVTTAEQLARRLEHLAASGDLARAGELVSDLVAAARHVLPELERFVASRARPEVEHPG